MVLANHNEVLTRNLLWFGGFNNIAFLVSLIIPVLSQGFRLTFWLNYCHHIFFNLCFLRGFARHFDYTPLLSLCSLWPLFCQGFRMTLWLHIAVLMLSLTYVLSGVVHDTLSTHCCPNALFDLCFLRDFAWHFDHTSLQSICSLWPLLSQGFRMTLRLHIIPVLMLSLTCVLSGAVHDALATHSCPYALSDLCCVWYCIHIMCCVWHCDHIIAICMLSDLCCIWHCNHIKCCVWHCDHIIAMLMLSLTCAVYDTGTTSCVAYDTATTSCAAYDTATTSLISLCFLWPVLFQRFCLTFGLHHCCPCALSDLWYRLKQSLTHTHTHTHTVTHTLTHLQCRLEQSLTQEVGHTLAEVGWKCVRVQCVSGLRPSCACIRVFTVSNACLRMGAHCRWQG